MNKRKITACESVLKVRLLADSGVRAISVPDCADFEYFCRSAGLSERRKA